VKQERETNLLIIMKSIIHKKDPNTGNPITIKRVVHENEDGEKFIYVSGGIMIVESTETSAYQSTGEWRSK